MPPRHKITSHHFAPADDLGVVAVCGGCRKTGRPSRFYVRFLFCRGCPAAAAAARTLAWLGGYVQYAIFI